MAFRILVIVSRPLNVDELPELADSWAISYGLNQIEVPVYISFLKPPTLEELANALAEHWDIVHFDGHAEEGSDGTFLVFEDETGLADKVFGHQLAELLSNQPPRLLILSACESAVGDDFGLAGELHSAGIPVCIGTVEKVSTAWTQAFMRPFYAKLGAGSSVTDAFNHATQTVESGIYSEDFQPLEFVGDGEIKLCDSGLRGEPTIVAPKLINWRKAWQGEFQGMFLDRDDSGEPIIPPKGRKGYIIRITRALTSGEKLVVISGLGGIGKSALSALIARRMAWKYPGGVFWVDGRDYLESQIPLEALLDLFSVLFGRKFLNLGTPQKRQEVLSYLGQPHQACLFVIDNAEGISESLMRFIRQLPDPSAALLTTQDTPEYGGKVIPLPAMEEEESLSLLKAEIERRGDDLPEIEQLISEDKTEELIEIIALLDNHPLALLHAAALLVSEGLERTLELVREHPAQGKETHERFDFSYVTLTEGQRSLLHKLASFSADFDEQAIETICTNEGFTAELLPDWSLDLRALCDRSFIEKYNLDVLLPGYRRFRLHPVLRDYVRTKVLQIIPESSDLSSNQLLDNQDYNIAQFYRSVTNLLASHLNDLEMASRAVITAHIEKRNLLAAQKTFATQNKTGEVIELCHLLDQLFRRSGDWTERRQAIEAGLRTAEAIGNQVEIGARLHNLAIVAMDMGELAEAKDLCFRSIEVSKQIEGPEGIRAIAQSVQLLGTIAFTAKKPDRARCFWEQSLDLAAEVGDQEVIGLSHLGLGMVATVNDNREEAQEQLEKALSILRDVDKKDQVAGVLHQFGVLSHSKGDYANARAAMNECLEMNKALTDAEGIAKAQALLALVDEQEGLFEDALSRTTEAEQIFIRLGNQTNIIQVRVQYRSIKAKSDEASNRT